MVTHIRAKTPRFEALRRPLALFLTLVCLILIGRIVPVGAWLEAGSTHLRSAGILGAVIFILAYSVGAMLFIPAAMFTFVAGFSLGALPAVLIGIPGIATSSLVAFLLSRTLLRRQVESLLRKDQRFILLDCLLSTFGARTVVLLRFSPVSPFSVLNFAFGLTGIPTRHYFVATCIGTIPGSIFFAQLGAVAPTLGCIVEGRLPDGGASQTAMLGIGIVLTAAVMLWLGRLAKRALARARTEALSDDTNAVE